MDKVPQIVLIGSTHKHLGKTTLICSFIRQLREEHRIAAIKIIPICDDACSIEEVSKKPEDRGDTRKMRAAGADHVYLIRSHNDRIGEAIEKLLELISVEGIDLIILESTSARSFIEPDCFILLSSDHSEQKSSARESAPLADHQINIDSMDLDSISILSDTDGIRIS